MSSSIEFFCRLKPTCLSYNTIGGSKQFDITEHLHLEIVPFNLKVSSKESKIFVHKKNVGHDIPISHENLP